MSKFGGGGVKCFICDKTAYPAETIQFEKVPYHVDCFRCKTCNKKLEGAAKASKYEEDIYCKQCFSSGGFAQKQRNVKWTKSATTTGATTSKFGGGGAPCTICTKTVYMAEMVQYEKKPYHADCFKCTDCDLKITTSNAALFEDAVKCRKCFQAGGYTQKQAKSGTSGSAKTNALASRFGGGGTKCTICEKTVYSAEQISFEKKPYHAECFKCTLCTKKIVPSNANAFEGDIICSKCFKDKGYAQKQTKTTKSTGGSSNALASKFGGGGTKCYVCEKTVYPAELISYEKKAFHSDCFKCKNCSIKVTPSNANGRKVGDDLEVYCKKCWQEGGFNRADKN